MFCGELVEKVNSAIDVGVPVRSSTNCFAASLTMGRLLPIEPDWSNSMAMFKPHFAVGSGTLFRASAHWYGGVEGLFGLWLHEFWPLTLRISVSGTNAVCPAGHATFHQ